MIDKNNNVRLTDIAERLNLTKVCVFKALRDHSDIGEDTKKRVKKVAKEIGYRPNLIARSLTSKKSRILGVIIPKIAHYFFAPVVEGIYNSAIESNYFGAFIRKQRKRKTTSGIYDRPQS